MTRAAVDLASGRPGSGHRPPRAVAGQSSQSWCRAVCAMGRSDCRRHQLWALKDDGGRVCGVPRGLPDRLSTSTCGRFRSGAEALPGRPRTAPGPRVVPVDDAESRVARHAPVVAVLVEVVEVEQRNPGLPRRRCVTCRIPKGRQAARAGPAESSAGGYPAGIVGRPRSGRQVSEPASGLDALRLVGPHGDLDPVPRAELVHQARQVRLDGAETDVELGRRSRRW